MHEILRAETRGTGVRASLISPSATDTPIWDMLSAELRGNYPSAEAMLRVEDVASAVLYAVTAPATVNVDELRLTRA
jgi:NADP-dependent 3-hydroxy acid dehydrogenase YdfG